jgi:hypothetical protein
MLRSCRSGGTESQFRGKVLVVNHTRNSELFPVNFPPALGNEAFANGGEVAWRPRFAAAAVEWFGANGYAVLGTELWLLKDGAIQSLPIGLSGMREVHGNTVDRQRKESWGEFVVRAAGETLAYLRAFRATDIIERGDIYFNVVWVSESDYAKLIPA